MLATVPLKSKLPVASRLACDANRVARDANRVARDAIASRRMTRMAQLEKTGPTFSRASIVSKKS